jgi:hypothetical protein
MLVFNKYFYKNKKSKLYFGDRFAVLNDSFTKPEGVLPLGSLIIPCQLEKCLKKERSMREYAGCKLCGVDVDS